MCSTAHRPAYPVDGSRPHSRARRTLLNGENGGARAGMPTHLPAHARPRAMSGAHSTNHLCGCYCSQAGCDSDAPHGTITSTVARAAVYALPHVCVPRHFRGCVWVPRLPHEACSVCDPASRQLVCAAELTCSRVLRCSGLKWPSIWTI